MEGDDEQLIENSPLESKATAERRAEAEAQGWIPPERFKGDPKDFRDADEYLERAELITPIVNQKNRELRTQLAAEKAARQALEARFHAQGTAIKVLQKAHEDELKASVAQAREDIKAEMAAASAEGDHVRMAELTSQLVELKDVEKTKPPVEDEGDKGTKSPDISEPTPAVRAWLAKPGNEWFGVDKRRTNYAIAVATTMSAELREQGRQLPEAEFFDLVNAEVDKSYPKQKGGGDTKVLSGNHGHNGGGNSIKTFKDLPKDARDACHQYTKQLVGPTRTHKTVADWEAAYTKTYLEEEGNK